MEQSLNIRFVMMRANAEMKAAHSNSVGIEHVFSGLLKLAEFRAGDLFNAPDFIMKTMNEDISVIRGMFAAAQIDTPRTRALLRYMAASSRCIVGCKRVHFINGACLYKTGKLPIEACRFSVFRPSHNAASVIEIALYITHHFVILIGILNTRCRCSISISGI